MRRNLGSASLPRRSGKAQHDKQPLGGDLRRIGFWVVLGRDFENIAAADVETEAAPEDRQGVRRTQAANLRRSRARREGRIQTVDVEGDIGRAAFRHFADPLHHRGRPHRDRHLGMNDGHAGIVRELLEVVSIAANANLDPALRVEHAVENRLTKGSAVVELAAFD
jgi:hypothetical protein